MTNTLFLEGRAGFLQGDIDWDADTIRIMLIDRDEYTFSGAHTFVTSIDTDAKIKIYEVAGGLGTKTTASGIADANDCTLSAVSANTSVVGAIIIYQDTGSPSTDRLIAWIDTATGIPASPNGGDITVQWSSGTSRIFML